MVSRVGVSFISTARACANVDAEMPEGTALRTVRQQTREAWNSDVFAKLTTSETNPTKLSQLYTALYFMHLIPANKTGENPLWQSREPYYDDIFTFWDTVRPPIPAPIPAPMPVSKPLGFHGRARLTPDSSSVSVRQHRCTTSLFHILQPTYHEELLRSMVDVWRHQGWVSDARSSFSNGAVQGGSNSDNVFADAFIKGVGGKLNWNDAFASMVKNAETVPSNNRDPRDPTGSTKEGRSALPDWLRLGYITPRFSRSVSRAIE